MKKTPWYVCKLCSAMWLLEELAPCNPKHTRSLCPDCGGECQQGRWHEAEASSEDEDTNEERDGNES